MNHGVRDTSDVWREPSSYKPARTLAWIATCGVVFAASTDGFAIVLDSLDRFGYANADVDFDDANIAQAMFLLAHAWSALAALAAFLFSASGFLLWIYRVTSNATTIGHRRPRTTPSMAVLCWFIPILHLFRPYRVVKSLHWASDPGYPVRGDWITRLPPVLPIWWTTWILTTILGNVSIHRSLSDAARDKEVSFWLNVASFPLTVVSAACVLAVLWSVQRRQEALANVDLDAPQTDTVERDDDDSEEP